MQSRFNPLRLGINRRRCRLRLTLERLERRLCLNSASLFQDSTAYLGGAIGLPDTFLLADATGDGKLDVVEASSIGRISVVPGNGDGTFLDRVITTNLHLTAPLAPEAIASSDFNGDGKIDLAMFEGANYAAVLYGKGDGTFQDPVHLPGGSGPFGFVAAGDFNGDGKPDFATVNDDAAFSATYTVFLNQGQGTFQATTTPLGTMSPSALVAADLNKDGKTDLVIADRFKSMKVLLAQGNGTFGVPVSYNLTNSPARLALGDFNGDGNVDIATASALNAPIQGSSMLLGDGHGSFQAAPDYSSDEAGFALAAADFNGDGKTDLVVGNEFGELSLLTATGGGAFSSFTHAPSVGNAVYGLATADLNGDGKPDIVSVNPYEPVFTVLLNRGDGTFAPETNIDLGSHSQVNLIVSTELNAVGNAFPADLNGDGKPDLLVETHPVQASDPDPPQLLSLLANGDGTYQTPVKSPILSPLELSFTDLKLADVNGDGKPDAIGLFNYQDTGGAIVVKLGNGAGGFSTSTRIAVSDSLASLVLADFNKDGKLDIAAAVSGASVARIFLGDGKGGFAPGVDYATGNAPQAVAVGDFNGDGKADLAVAYQGIPFMPGDYPLLPLGDAPFPDVNGGMSILLGNGDGSFQARHDWLNDIPDPNAPPIPGLDPVKLVRLGGLAVADLDGNGLSDIVSDDMHVMLSTGGGNFQFTTNPIASPFSTGHILAADVNGDGVPDLLESSGLGGDALGVLLGDGNGTFQAPRYVPLAHTGVFALQDVNGDGKPDLIASAATSLLGDEQNLRFIPNTSTPPGPSQIQLSSTTATVDEGAQVTITLTRTGDTTGAASVHVVIDPASTAEANDYQPLPNGGLVTFSAGQTMQSVQLQTIDDAAHEPNVTVVVDLQSPKGATLGSPTQETVTIVDNEPPPQSSIQFSTTTASVAEGGAVALQLARTGDTSAPASVTVAVDPASTATSADYQALANTGVVTFASGQTTQTIKLHTINDKIFDPNETVVLVLQSPTGATLGAANKATVIIRSHVAGDFDGDGKTDTAAFDQTTATFYELFSGGSGRILQFGNPAHINTPISADFDGDGKTDTAVYDQITSTFYELFSGGGGRILQFGNSAHMNIPIAADFDGDGKTDTAIYDQTASIFYELFSGGGARILQFGNPAHINIPIAADFDGDGKTDTAIYDQTSATFYALPSGGGAKILQFGNASDQNVPIAADFDGDGKTDISVYDRRTATFYELFSGGGARILQFGNAAHSNIPVNADLDGDGNADTGVYDQNSSVFYELLSGGGAKAVQFGDPGHRNVPVTAAYVSPSLRVSRFASSGESSTLEALLPGTHFSRRSAAPYASLASADAVVVITTSADDPSSGTTVPVLVCLPSCAPAPTKPLRPSPPAPRRLPIPSAPGVAPC